MSLSETQYCVPSALPLLPLRSNVIISRPSHSAQIYRPNRRVWRVFRRLGAYSSQEVYTPAAMAHLVRYARLRGVRVLLELDIPSHCGAGWTWGPRAGLGDLVLCFGKQPWRQFCLQPPCGQLNPVNPNVVEVLRYIFRDVLATWPADAPLHMGGDEVIVTRELYLNMIRQT